MGFLASLFSQAGVGWLVRRVFDWGGWIGGTLGTLLALFASLDPITQSAILTALQGRWQDVTLGGAVGFVIWGLSQWRSWRATVKPHVTDGEHLRVLTEAEAREITGYRGPIQDRSK